MGYTNDITGFILAGGLSRRLGRDKRVVKIDGIPLLERTRRLLSDFTNGEPFFVGDNLDGLGLEPSKIIGDAKPGCGPAGGLVSALDTSPTDWCLVIAVDLPHLKLADLERIATEKCDCLDVITLSHSGDPEPLVALYHARTKKFWSKRLEIKEYSLVAGIRSLSWKPVMVPRGSRALYNLNTPADLRRLVFD